MLKETTEGEDVFYHYLVSGQVGTEQLHVFKDVGALVVHHAVPPWLLEAAMKALPHVQSEAMEHENAKKAERAKEAENAQKAEMAQDEEFPFYSTDSK